MIFLCDAGVQPDAVMVEAADASSAVVAVPRSQRLRQPANEAVVLCRQKPLRFGIFCICLIEAWIISTEGAIHDTGIHVANVQIEQKTPDTVDEKRVSCLAR